MRALVLACAALALAGGGLAHEQDGPLALDASGVALGPTTQNTAEVIVPDLCAEFPLATIYLDAHHADVPVRVTMDPDPCAADELAFTLELRNDNAGLLLQGVMSPGEAHTPNVDLQRPTAALTGMYFGKQLVVAQ
ncbi:MAG TPA: hypothetical protein VGR28_08700 [Candidatus Thermoplasmatota archaeon]|jgi:hypothetical protein|nr:hypothetical protein [Candidatus Thermoplasmatota archaeon]